MANPGDKRLDPMPAADELAGLCTHLSVLRQNLFLLWDVTALPTSLPHGQPRGVLTRDAKDSILSLE